ncbi:hypothetical protein Q9189_007771 [Teloschistes chrysophthalmus]
MSSIHEVYRQVPLSTTRDQIRLLRLQQTSGSDIICELKAIDLKPFALLPDYTALSYRWHGGLGPREDLSIWINGHTLSVQPKVHAYLKLMRDERNYGWIFIDSICINQDMSEHNDEKIDQILLMGDVYREAAEVVAWMGESWPAWMAYKGTEEIALLDSLMAKLAKVYNNEKGIIEISKMRSSFGKSFSRKNPGKCRAL